MLRCKGIETGDPERIGFRILEEDRPAATEALDRFARLGDILLRENRLAGRFVVEGPGFLALEVSEAERTFFYNGIVFAALDAVNDPVRNPTLTLLADDSS